MNNKSLCILFFIYCFVIISKSQIESCIYKNTLINQTYDINPLISNSSYVKSYNAYLTGFGYKLYFNFCNVSVSNCNERACQDSSNAGSLSIPEEIEYYDDPFKAMRILYTTTKLNAGVCEFGSPKNYRFTSIILNCEPNVDFLINSLTETFYCKYSIDVSTKYVCRTCPLNCSGHGICNPYKGLCDCDSQTNGLGCENSRLFISSSDSAYETTGGFVNIYGYFGNFSSSAKVLIGDKNCENPVLVDLVNNTTLKCFIGPGSGVHNISFFDGDLNVTSVNTFRYVPREYECLNGCNNKGKCDTTTGICECFAGYSGPDCLSLNSTSNSTTGVNENGGSSSISNSNSNFNINIYSLVEYQINGDVENEYILYNKWKQISTTNYTDSIITIFNQNITTKNNKNCTIQYTVEQIIQPKSYSFATQNFKLESNSFKVTVSILLYSYQSNLNYLQLRILSTINSTNNCKELNTDGVNNLQSSNYITIKKENSIFYGRFLPLMLSDNRATFTSTNIVSKNSTSILIGLSMSHCLIDCTIDPDFSLLVSTETYSCEKERKWFLPVVIIAPVVGATLLVILSSILYKRHRTSLKIAAAALKPAKLQNLN